MIRFLNTLLIIFLGSVPFLAEGKINITSGWDVETGVHDGRKCLLSPFKITAEDMDGMDCEVHLYLADSKGKITKIKDWKQNERGESYYPLTLHIKGNYAVFSYKDCNFPLLYFDDIILSEGQNYNDIRDGYIVLTEKGELPDIGMAGDIESSEKEEDPVPAVVLEPQICINQVTQTHRTANNKYYLRLYCEGNAENLVGKYEMRVVVTDTDHNKLKFRSYKKGVPRSDHKSFYANFGELTTKKMDGYEFNSELCLNDIVFPNNSDKFNFKVYIYNSESGEMLAESSYYSYDIPTSLQKISPKPTSSTSQALAQSEKKSTSSSSGKSNSTSSKQVNKEEPLYESTYYYTGVMDSGTGLVQACDPSPAQKVKIYKDRILFGNLLYRFNGYYNFNGLQCPKYEAVDDNGNNMPNKYLIRANTELAEILELDIMGFRTKTMSLINEGMPPAKNNVSPGYAPSSPSPAYPSTQPTPQKPKQCGLCNGTGHFGKKHAAIYSYSVKVRCNECGDWDYPHYHPDCPSCNGKGYY